VQVALERAYVETASSCDAYITRGVISQQPQAQPQMLVPGMQVAPPTLPLVATLEVTSERWEALA
jgi:hypothetical protein